MEIKQVAVFCLCTFVLLAPHSWAETPLKTVLIVDRSGSMQLRWYKAYDPEEQAQNWFSALLKRTKDDDSDIQPHEFALVQFEDKADETASFAEIDDVLEAMAKSSRAKSGIEDGYRAIRLALQRYYDPEEPGLHFLLMTDEDRHEGSPRELQQLIVELREKNVTVDLALHVYIRCIDSRSAYALTGEGEGLVRDDQNSVSCGRAELHEPPQRDRNDERPSSSVEDYAALALETGGTIWAIDYLKQVGSSLIATHHTQANVTTLADTFADALRERAHNITPNPVVALMDAAPLTPAPGDLVTLDGSPSWHRQPGEFIADWRWDTDGDGTPDQFGEVVAVSFDTAGTHKVTLEVEDRDGNRDTTALNFTVE